MNPDGVVRRIIDGQTGSLVDSTDESGLITALLTLLQNPDPSHVMEEHPSMGRREVHHRTDCPTIPGLLCRGIG